MVLQNYRAGRGLQDRSWTTKQIVSLICHLRNTFFAAATFKASSEEFFRQSNKVYGMFWSVQVFFAYLEKRTPNRYWLWKENLVFPM